MKEVAADSRENWQAEHLEHMREAQADREVRQTVREAERAVSRSFADAGNIVGKGLRFTGRGGLWPSAAPLPVKPFDHDLWQANNGCVQGETEV